MGLFDKFVPKDKKPEEKIEDKPENTGTKVDCPVVTMGDICQAKKTEIAKCCGRAVCAHCGEESYHYAGVCGIGKLIKEKYWY